MEDFNLLAPLLLAIVGLLAGAILKSILKRTGFPYTVGLFVFGLLIGLLNQCCPKRFSIKTKKRK